MSPPLRPNLLVANGLKKGNNMKNTIVSSYVTIEGFFAGPVFWKNRTSSSAVVRVLNLKVTLPKITGGDDELDQSA